MMHAGMLRAFQNILQDIQSNPDQLHKILMALQSGDMAAFDKMTKASAVK